MIENIVEGSYLKRLDNIVQWLERDKFNQESVSQHSFKVAVFTRVLLEDIFRDGTTPEIEKFKLEAVTHALFHDFDEAIILRDLPHNFKYNEYNGTAVRQAVDSFVAKEFWRGELSSTKKEDDAAVRVLSTAIIHPDACVHVIVKLADWTALLFYCRRELALHNENFKKTYDYCCDNIMGAVDNVVKAVLDRFDIDVNFLVESYTNIIKSSIYGEKDY